MNPVVGWLLLAAFLCCTLLPALVLLVGTLREVAEADPLRGRR